MSRNDSQPNKSLYIRNVPEDTRREDLEGVFRKYGTVRDVYIPLNYFTGKQRGFAYIQLEHLSDAVKAVNKLRTFKLHGHVLETEYAQGDRKTAGEMRAKQRSRFNSDTSRRSPPLKFTDRRANKRRTRSRSRSPRRRRHDDEREERARSRNRTERRPSRSIISHSPRRGSGDHRTSRHLSHSPRKDHKLNRSRTSVSPRRSDRRPSRSSISPKPSHRQREDTEGDNRRRHRPSTERNDERAHKSHRRSNRSDDTNNGIATNKSSFKHRDYGLINGDMDIDSEQKYSRHKREFD